MECTNPTNSSTGEALAMVATATEETSGADAPNPTAPTDAHSSSGSSASMSRSSSPTSSPSYTCQGSSSTILTYRALLTSFPQGRVQWWQQHCLALTRSRSVRTSITERISSLRNTKVERSAELDYRQRVFIQSISSVPEPYYLNWKLWAAWLGQVDKLIAVAKKQEVWLRLLEDEYDKAVKTWEQFWGFVESDEASIEDEQCAITKSKQRDESAHVDVHHHHDKENKEDTAAKSSKEIGAIANAAATRYDRNQPLSRGLSNHSPDRSAPSLTTTGSDDYPSHHSDSQDQASQAQPSNDHESQEDKTTLYEVLQSLSEFNQKKIYLQAKIIEANASIELRAFWGDGEPEWIDWGAHPRR